MSNDGKFVAYIDEVSGKKTVRTCNCELLVSDSKCLSCQKYRSNLRAIYSKWSKQQAENVQISDSSSHTPEKKTKVDDLKKRVHAAEASVKWLKEKIRKLMEDHGETIDNELHSDLLTSKYYAK